MFKHSIIDIWCLNIWCLINTFVYGFKHFPNIIVSYMHVLLFKASIWKSARSLSPSQLLGAAELCRCHSLNVCGSSVSGAQGGEQTKGRSTDGAQGHFRLVSQGLHRSSKQFACHWAVAHASLGADCRRFEPRARASG